MDEDYSFIRCEHLDNGEIVRIWLNRPKVRNAQNRGLLVELNDAFLAAECDDAVRVVILGATGAAFSAGHDMGSKEAVAERMPGEGQHPTMRGYGAGTRSGTSSSRTLCAGGTCGRSPSLRSTAPCIPRA
jgi:enoyl-CoA hydratase